MCASKLTRAHFRCGQLRHEAVRVSSLPTKPHDHRLPKRIQLRCDSTCVLCVGSALFANAHSSKAPCRGTVCRFALFKSSILFRNAVVIAQDHPSSMEAFSAALPEPAPSQNKRRSKRLLRRCERLICGAAKCFPLVFVYGLTTWAVWVQGKVGFGHSKDSWTGMKSSFEFKSESLCSGLGLIARTCSNLEK